MRSPGVIVVTCVKSKNVRQVVLIHGDEHLLRCDDQSYPYQLLDSEEACRDFADVMNRAHQARKGTDK